MKVMSEAENKDLIQILKAHYSVREFTDEPVSEETIATIIDCAQMAPTSSYLQAYTIIRVSNKEKREKLKEYSGGQNWVQDAPVVLLFCADLHRIEQVAGPDDKDILHNGELYTVGVIDGALAAQKALIAAQVLGLGGVVVGGIRNEVEEVARLFNLPNLVFPMFALCLGYPAQPRSEKPRLPRKVILGNDRYPDVETGDVKEAFEDYEREVYDYFEKLTSGRSKRTWSQRVKYAIENKPRYNVTEFLKKAGFLKK